MRAAQVTIKVELFAEEAIKDYPHVEIEVYADSNNVFESLASANHEVLKEIEKLRGNIGVAKTTSTEKYKPNR